MYSTCIYVAIGLSEIIVTSTVLSILRIYVPLLVHTDVCYCCMPSSPAFAFIDASFFIYHFHPYFLQCHLQKRATVVLVMFK